MATYHFDFLAEYVNQTINSLINEENFDLDTFNIWVIENNIKFKSNPSAYVNKIFKQELDKGTFKKPEEPEIQYLPAIEPFLSLMRDMGIKVLPNDSLYLDNLYIEMLKCGVPQEEIIKSNHYILDNLMHEGDDTTKFIDLIKKSKLMKQYSVDLELVATNYEKQLKEWDELLSDIQTAEEMEGN